METPTFTCQPCNFTTSLKANLVRHQNTAKHIKICECQEVVTKTVIEVVNTENKEPINSVNNQLLDKMEELTKKNESLEETIKKLQKTIEMMAWNMAKESISLITPPTPPIEEKNEPINVVIPISIPLEPLHEVVAPKKRIRNKVVLLEENKEEKKESTESLIEKEKMMRMEMELKELKAKTSENPIDYIEDTHKYMCQAVQKDKRGYIEIDTIYGLCEKYSSHHLPTNLSYNEQEGLPDCEKEYRAMFIKFLKSELTDIDENKRPIVFYKKQLYIRQIVGGEHGLIYQWVQVEINELISIVDKCINKQYVKLKTDDLALTNFMNHRIKEEKYSKVLDAIMPLILLK